MNASQQQQVNRWRKRDGEWVVEVAMTLGQGGQRTGETVTVTRKDNSTSEVTLGKWVGNGSEPHPDDPNYRSTQFYQVAPKPKAEQPKAQQPDVPAGYYAVTSATGNNDLDFYRVSEGKAESKWAGYKFVQRVIGGHPDTNIRGTEAKAALQRIADAGWQEAAVLYGKEIGRCGVCNRHLTDEESRAYGIGPVCRDGF